MANVAFFVELWHVTAYTLEIVGRDRGHEMTKPGSDKAKSNKPRKSSVKTKVVRQRRQKDVLEIQAHVEASSKDVARAKRAARKATVDQQESEKLQESQFGQEGGDAEVIEDPRGLGQEVTDLRVMVEGLTTRLVETQSILSSFTAKIEMLLLKRSEEGTDGDCVIEEVVGASGGADGVIMKHDSLFMRNVSVTGSNLAVLF